ncbi:MAG: DUF885 domain-containing protein [Psychroserpens sp.]|nr:DUF885 domain-containing protein [Psychroserpens sp.]
MKSIKYTLIKLSILLLVINQPSCAQDINFDAIRIDFVKRYTELEIPFLQIDYTQNIQAIKGADSIKIQVDFFQEFKEKLADIEAKALSEYQELDFNIMRYEVDMNLERLELERQWDSTTLLDNSNSIVTIPNGKKWYAYLLKRWVNDLVTPDEIFQFGLTEIEKVKTEMKAIQVKSGLSKEEFTAYLKDSSFYFNNFKDVQKAFEDAKQTVAKNSPRIFPFIDQIPDVGIAQGTNPSLAHVPAYYNDRTFFFNYFDKPYNKRQIGWIYIHEGIPGHHYQGMVNDIIKRTAIQELFWYSGFVEGWGAYVEYLSDELGVYKTIYDEYGKWEWDLIRSVRVALDIGINYYGWSDRKSISFWKEHISDQDDIGWREIARMKRWPAQVITYKYGSDKFLKLLNKSRMKEDFEYKNFHKELLKYGDIPISQLDFNFTID